MNVRSALPALLFTFLFFSCKKSSEHTTTPPPPPQEKDCKTHNYAILSVIYADATHAHSTTVQPYLNNALTGNKITKIFPIGTLRDTMHFPPNTYAIFLDALEPGGSVHSEFFGSLGTFNACDSSSATAAN